MEILKDNLSHEAGPYAQRTSALKFADLVTRAGGRMRALPRRGGGLAEQKVRLATRDLRPLPHEALLQILL